jgi:HEAT repeat protein
MNQILEWLSGGDLRSDGLSNEVAELVLNDPQLFSDLLEGLDHPDNVVRGRTADALEKVTRSRPDLTVDHLPRLINLLETDRVPMVKMHLAMILGHLAVYDEHIHLLTPALLDSLDDDSVFAISWAIVSLCIIGRKYPEEREGIINRIAKLEGDHSAAIRSKVRYALAILMNEEVPFPKGWIKSRGLLDI